MQNFKVVNEAAQFVCAKCGNKQLDVSRATAGSKQKDKLYLICGDCEVIEAITKEEWDKALGL